jgi:putative transposase
VEEMMAERGISLDHSTLNRWVIRYAPKISEEVKRRRRAIGKSWRLDETYVKVRGQWKYLYRAVDKENNTIDFLLTAKRDQKAARRFLNKAIKSSGEPVKINIDKSGANTAAIESYNKDNCTSIEIRQNKYLNNIVEQDHRFIKKKVRTTLGFKKFHAAQATIAGIEAMRMIKKGQLRPEYSKNRNAVEQFYSLAA